MALTQVKIDKSFTRNVGYRTPLSNNISIPLPSGKILGAPCRTYEVPIAQQLNSATFIMTAGADFGIAGLAINKQWNCTRDSVASHEEAIHKANMANLDIGARLDQIVEGTTHDHPGIDVNAVRGYMVTYYNRAYERLQAEKGITHPSQHNWFGDYFLAKLGQARAFAHYTHPDIPARMDLFKTLLSTEENARRHIAYNPSSHVYSLGGTDEFFARGLHNSMNRHFDGYYNTGDLPDPAHWYHALFMSEMHHLGNSGVKLVAFDHTTVVDGESGNANGGTHLRTPLNPVHNVAISNGWNSISTNGSWQIPQSFLSFLLMDGSLVWNEMFVDSNDIAKWSYHLSPTESQGNLKTYKTMNGLGPFENYDGSFPEPSIPSSQGRLRGPRVVGNNLVFAGAKYYSEIASTDDRVSGGVFYAENNYSVNGTSTQNGYNGTDVPTYGSLGNARLSDKTHRNYNNTNSLELCKLGKPIVLRTVNSAGTKEAFVIGNPYAKDSDTTVYTIKDKDGDTHVTPPLQGDRLYILKVD